MKPTFPNLAVRDISCLLNVVKIGLHGKQSCVVKRHLFHTLCYLHHVDNLGSTSGECRMTTLWGLEINVINDWLLIVNIGPMVICNYRPNIRTYAAHVRICCCSIGACLLWFILLKLDRGHWTQFWILRSRHSPQTSYFKNRSVVLTLSDYPAENQEYVQTTPVAWIPFGFWSLKSN